MDLHVATAVIVIATLGGCAVGGAGFQTVALTDEFSARPFQN